MPPPLRHNYYQLGFKNLPDQSGMAATTFGLDGTPGLHGNICSLFQAVVSLRRNPAWRSSTSSKLAKSWSHSELAAMLNNDPPRHLPSVNSRRVSRYARFLG